MFDLFMNAQSLSMSFTNTLWTQVRSRGFTVIGDPYMIPGADMFNHDPNKQSVQIGTDGDDYFVMKTVSDNVANLIHNILPTTISSIHTRMVL